MGGARVRGGSGGVGRKGKGEEQLIVPGYRVFRVKKCDRKQ